MALEAATYIDDLVASNPVPGDGKSQGDDHLRLIKAAVKATFPGLAGRFSRVQGKSAGYNLAVNDNGTVLQFTGAGPYTLGSIAVATLGNGYGVLVVNDSSADVTFDPNSTEQVNGATTLVIRKGYVGWIYSTGAAFIGVVARKTGDEGPGADVTGNITLGASDVNKTRIITASSTVQLPALSAVAVGDKIKLKSMTLGNVVVDPAGADTLDGLTANWRLPAYTYVEIEATASGWMIVISPGCYVGEVRSMGSPNIPQGWVPCDWTAISRTTYAGYFAEVGTLYGPGDGSTTVNVPDGRGAVLVGDGTGTIFLEFTNAEITTATDLITVSGNTHELYTGMQGVFTRTSGSTDPTTSGAGQLDSGDTVFLIVISSTTFKFASSLANAQNGTPIDITAAGSGTFRFTHTRAARTQGRKGGEEAHAMSITELLSHRHQQSNAGSSILHPDSSGTPSPRTTPEDDTDPTGGNAAMNIMQPYTVVKHMIKV